MAPPDPDHILKCKALEDRKPVENVTHIMRDMVKLKEPPTCVIQLPSASIVCCIVATALRAWMLDNADKPEYINTQFCNSEHMVMISIALFFSSQLCSEQLDSDLKFYKKSP